MGIINLTTDEKEAISAIDESELDKLIDQAVAAGRLGDLSRQPLSRCGEYVSAQYRHFERSFAAYAQAKSSKKISETKYQLDRDARNLSFAVRQMKRRREKEEQNAQFFHVDDHIMWPHRFSDDLSVRVGFRWRKGVDDDWTFGSITFTHQVTERPSYP